MTGAVSAVLVAPFFLHDMLSAIRSGSNQANKATVFGMCIGGASCLLFPVSFFFRDLVAKGFEQVYGDETIFAVAILSFFLAVPGMLVGALLGRISEAVLRRRWLETKDGQTVGR
jgi:hypothetical protein